MRNLVKLVVIILALTACSSVPRRDKVDEKPMCLGKAATKKYVSTISFYQGIPKGMDISKVSVLVKSRSELQDNVTQSFVSGLIYLSVNGGRYSSRSQNQRNAALNPSARYLAEERSEGLVETGRSNFLFCIWDDCNGLKDPITNAVIKSNDDGKQSSLSSMRLRRMYYVDGIIDPSERRYDRHRESSYSSPSPAYVDWTEYFERHSFPGGEFLVDNYLNVPDSVKKGFCEKAGRPADCFEAPKPDNWNAFVTNHSFWNEAPFEHDFLPIGYNSESAFNSIAQQIKSDPFTKMKWEDAVAKDLFLKLSTSTTRKVEKNWIITRIEWNPTLFCRYAHPNSDLISR